MHPVPTNHQNMYLPDLSIIFEGSSQYDIMYGTIWKDALPNVKKVVTNNKGK